MHREAAARREDGRRWVTVVQELRAVAYGGAMDSWGRAGKPC